MATRKITNKKELPHNAKVLHPDGKWRDKKGRITKRPIDEPSYKYDGKHYRKYSPPAPKSKKSKKPKKAKKQEPAVITESIPQRLWKPKTLGELLGKRNLRYDSQDVAAAIQEATARDIENRMLLASRALEALGIPTDVKISVSPDLTINTELAIHIQGVSIREIFELMKENLTFPPTVWGSLGFRFAELGDKIRGSFPVVSARTGDIVASKKNKLDAYQVQSGYMQKDTALRNIWRFAESFIFKIYSKDNEDKNRPVEIFVRMHWNPFMDDDGKPLAPTRQE